MLRGRVSSGSPLCLVLYALKGLTRCRFHLVATHQGHRLYHLFLSGSLLPQESCHYVAVTDPVSCQPASRWQKPQGWYRGLFAACVPWLQPICHRGRSCSGTSFYVTSRTQIKPTPQPPNRDAHSKSLLIQASSPFSKENFPLCNSLMSEFPSLTDSIDDDFM